MKAKNSIWLIWLCWLVYTCSYIGKVNYAANINQVMAFYNVDHSAAGLVSTFFFFAYGVGQIVHGLLCKKYNIKWVVLASLTISAMVNLIVGITTNFTLIKFLWMLNGFAMSVLWPCLIRLLSETLAKKEMSRATLVMGTTVGIGTFFVYATSAAFVRINFRFSFYTATAVFVVVAILWVLFSSLLIKKASEEGEREDALSNAGAVAGSNSFNKSLILLSIVVLCFYGVATNLIKDGLTTWVPSILKEEYKLDDSLSIILTLALPIVAIFGNAFAVSINKKIPDYVLQCAVTFFCAGLITVGIIFGMQSQQLVLTLIGFVVVCLLASSCNSVITSIFPLYMKGKVNSGRIAGILNGFCYVGSTISSYGLGWIADNHGWLPVFWVLCAVCGVVCVGAGIYLALRKKLKECKKGKHRVESLQGEKEGKEDEALSRT